MPLSKLTLSVDRELIEKAKKMAANEGTSLSAVFTRLIRSLLSESETEDRIGPLTRKATGLIEMPARLPEEVVLEDSLSEKYEIK